MLLSPKTPAQSPPDEAVADRSTEERAESVRSERHTHHNVPAQPIPLIGRQQELVDMNKQPQTELFERDSYFDALHTLLRDTTAGQGCLVLLGGEAGVGKTALIQQFCAAAQKIAHVHLSTCDPL